LLVGEGVTEISSSSSETLNVDISTCLGGGDGDGMSMIGGEFGMDGGSCIFAGLVEP
jgi:hypothetical protein